VRALRRRGEEGARAVPGVEAVEVTLSPPRAVVSCDPSRTTVEMLLKATAEEGYPSTPAAG